MILGASSRPATAHSGIRLPGAVSAPLASAGFVLLFPVFVVYHYGLSAGWWPALLGGLFAAATVLVAAFAIASVWLLAARREDLNLVHLLFAVTIIHMTVWSFGQLPFVTHENLLGAIAIESFATIAIWIAVLFVGSQFPRDDRSVRRLAWWSLAPIVACFVHAFIAGGFPAGVFLAFANADEGGHSTYQGIGRSLLAAGSIAAFGWRPYTLRALLVLVGTALLMLALGSRAHFFVLCVMVLLQLLLLTVRRDSRWLGLSGLLFTALVAAASVGLFLETRAAEVLDLASSSSWEERTIANARAWSVIETHPWSGSFGYHAWDPAGYAHNLLSAWTQYGLPGFVLFLTTLFVVTLISILGVLRGQGDEAAWLLALHLNIVAAVLAIASEPMMSSVFPPLAWGFTLRALRTVPTKQLSRGVI